MLDKAGQYYIYSPKDKLNHHLMKSYITWLAFHHVNQVLISYPWACCRKELWRDIISKAWVICVLIVSVLSIWWNTETLWGKMSFYIFQRVSRLGWWSRKTNTEYRRHHLWAGVWDWVNKRKWTDHQHPSLSASWLYVHCDELPQTPALCFPCHDGQRYPFFLNMLLTKYFITATGKATTLQAVIRQGYRMLEAAWPLLILTEALTI